MGQVIAGRFELIEPLARGGQGTVWLAHDVRHDRRCAAKVLAQADSAALLRFVREQGVQVEHPHLVSPYGWAAEDHEVAIAMPLVRGGSLEAALRDHGALSEPLAACLLLQLLDGLAALHAAGWVHRDVTPGNVLLEPTGTGVPHARLGDMGLAVRDDDARLTSFGAVPGTPGYVAPETAEGAGPSPAQDLWAAGVTVLRTLRPELQFIVPEDVDEALAGIVAPGLAEVLGRHGLLAAEPAARAAAAAAAPEVLAGLAERGAVGGGHVTAAGEPFEVFDHVADRAEEHAADPDSAAVLPGRPAARGRPAADASAAGAPKSPAGEASRRLPPTAARWGVALLVVGGLALLVAVVLLLLG